MNYSRKAQLAALVASCLLGVLTRPMVAGFRGGDAVGEKIEISSLGAGLGRGVSLAALGGYRSLAANLVWVGMYAEWSHRRLEETRRGIELAVALNPDLTFFWIDGARIIANDMPV